MNLNEFIPMFIRQDENMRPKGVVTASRWNELWDLTILQGDHSEEAIQTLVAEVLNRYTKLESDALLAGNTNDLVKTVDVNLTTGVITITKKDGAITTFDTALEKVPATFEIIESAGKYYLKITNVDGTTSQTDLTNLMDVYNYNNTATISFVKSGTGNVKTITAEVRDASIGLEKLSITAISQIESWANTASNGAATATTQATTATTKATEAATSADTASSKATEASGSAQIAVTKAGEASTSAVNALSSANSAAASASTATTKASEAAASATAADASKNQAATSATNAATSEANALASKNAAAASATDANTKATAAATSATNANNSANAAASSAASASGAAATAVTKANEADASADAAALSAASAQGIDTLSRSYAVGGTGTRPGEDTDNAKYYKEQAAIIVGGDYVTQTELNAALTTKVDVVTGKQLSTEDYTTAEKTKLGTVETNANNYVHPTTAGNKHIPTGGASNQFLKYSASGTAVWSDLPMMVESCIVTVSTSDSQPVAGQTITLTNLTDNALSETYTLLSGETTHTFKIIPTQVYKISVDAKPPYMQPAETAEFSAVAGNIRGVSMVYEKMFRYGYRRTKAESNPDTRIQYLFDAVGMTPAYMDFTSGNFNYGSWQTFTEEVSRPVMLKTDGTVDYELSRNDMTKRVDGVTSSDVSNTAYEGNAMIEFRKYKWVKRYEDATYEYVIFSNFNYDGTYNAYAHTDLNGVVKDTFYWGAFKGSYISSKMRSFANQTVEVSQTRNIEVSYATANGSGYYTIYKSGWEYIGDLLTLISKSDNSQTKFGSGRSKSTTAIATGTLKAQPYFKGYNDETSDVKVFGIEGFWGNVWEGMAGLVYNGQIRTKMIPPYNFDGTGYTLTGVVPSGTSGGFINTASVTDTSGFVPKTANGSGTTYYCDGLWFDTSQVDYALVGGVWAYALLDGCRCVDLSYLASDTRTYVGSRLSYINPA